MRPLFSFVLLMFASFTCTAQLDDVAPSQIYRDASYADFEVFMKIAQEAKEHRADRLLSLEKFQEMSSDSNTIILDTRSKEMYDAKHIKGAVHLNFADFTQTTLATLIEDTNTRILIYCNNNFLNDEIYFPTKAMIPIDFEEIRISSLPNGPKEYPVTMALNIPTYINLYGYGYKNVYELADLISVYYEGIEFEGTSVVSN